MSNEAQSGVLPIDPCRGRLHSKTVPEVIGWADEAHDAELYHQFLQTAQRCSCTPPSLLPSDKPFNGIRGLHIDHEVKP
ncbi:Hypothetical predicted protein, partial [Pelobates cultripes]